MPHPIYGPPNHRLTRVTATMSLPVSRLTGPTTVRIVGEAQTSRGELWSVAETWQANKQVNGLEPSDWAGWVLLSAWQDRPNSQQALERALRPVGWDEPQLPF